MAGRPFCSMHKGMRRADTIPFCLLVCLVGFGFIFGLPFGFGFYFGFGVGVGCGFGFVWLTALFHKYIYYFHSLGSYRQKSMVCTCFPLKFASP